ncbi:LOW QUALITY PROTEIN: beta-1,4-glucuronyltransferase 1 [Spheniscus humboldti]
MSPPRGVLDTSGTFRVYRDLLGTPPRWDPPELVLATHGTPGRVAGTLGGALGGLWEGPLSVAVFGVPEVGLGELLAALGGPCRGLRGRLRLHVVVGAAAPPPAVSPNPGPPTPGGCRGALRRLAAADPPSYTLGVPYPGNLLRNVAWAGAAEEKGAPPRNGGLGPPKIGGRFVLLLDADVVPSRGLREEFLRLVREGGAGLGPPIWGAAGFLGDPPAQGAAGLLGDPDVLGAPGVLGDPKALGAAGVLGDPLAGRAPDGLGGLRVSSALDPPHVPGVPNDPGVLNALEVPNRLGVPSMPGVPNVPGVPNAISNMGVPNALQVPNVPKVPNTFSDPGVPNALEVPKGFRDPGVPNTLEDPNALKDSNALEDPNSLGATTPSWDRVVFVLPAFEVRTGTRVPGTKAELRGLWGTGDARPFYGTLCPRCQAPTGYGRWWALPPTPHLRVAYEAPWRDPWEPFYVGPARGVPPFDERFLQYGFNRISQACELHMAGFRFAVLDGAFVVRGFKEAGGFHGGRAELHRNRQLFRHFRAELRQRYPRSPRRC